MSVSVQVQEEKKKCTCQGKTVKNLVQPSTSVFEGLRRGGADQVGTVQVGRQGNYLLDETKLGLFILLTGSFCVY